MTIQEAVELALQHHQAGRLSEAERGYRQVLAAQPNHPDALHLLGLMAYQLKKYDVAIDLIHRAINVRPDSGELFENLAKVLDAAGRADEAIDAYRKALSRFTGSAELYNNLGVLLKHRGRLDDAIDAFQHALAAHPADLGASCNLGETLRERRRLDEAISLLSSTVKNHPDSAAAFYNLGVALQDKELFDEAVAAHRQAVQLMPDLAVAWGSLASLYEKSGRYDQAVSAASRAIELDPQRSEFHILLGNSLKSRGEVAQAIQSFRRAVEADPSLPLAHNNLCYALHFDPASDARSVYEEHRRFNHRFAAPLAAPIEPYSVSRDPRRRLRIGYVSPDFCEHAITRFLLPLLEHHDKNEVEVFCYADVSRPDSWTNRVRVAASAWREIRGMTDEQVARLVRADRIDILVDLSAHMHGNRLLMFARKPAPIQVTYLSYCSTTGLDAMDYRISDPFLGPLDQDEQKIYSERTIRLPQSYWCYAPVPLSPEISPLPARDRGFVTFGCLNTFAKVSRGSLNAWCRILCSVPGSRLMLHAQPGSHCQQVAELMNSQGIDPARLQIAPYVPLLEYLRLYQQIDIGLDPFPYNGGTTTCDALWMGVPVVSTIGRTAVGRAGASLLHNVGLAELVTDSQDQYVRRAIELAGDLSRLAELRTSLRTRMQASPLMDALRFARNVEAAYRRIWEDWCSV